MHSAMKFALGECAALNCNVLEEERVVGLEEVEERTRDRRADY